MKIKGKYEKDSNFTTVYTDDSIYTITHNGQYARVMVGEMTATGHVLTKDALQHWKEQCVKEGVFEI